MRNMDRKNKLDLLGQNLLLYKKQLLDYYQINRVTLLRADVSEGIPSDLLGITYMPVNIATNTNDTVVTPIRNWLSTQHEHQ